MSTGQATPCLVSLLLVDWVQVLTRQIDASFVVNKAYHNQLAGFIGRPCFSSHLC
jgi:hypothetical protein